jgi:hypothetical protein
MKGASPLDYQERMADAEDEAAVAALAALDHNRNEETPARTLKRARASEEQAAFHRWLARRLRAFGFR